MSGHKESIVSMGITIQPTPGTFNPPTSSDLIAISAPDNGSDAITADDDTLNGSLWGVSRQFLGTRGRAGATARLRGPGGATPPAANAWVLGRILQAAGFTEFRNSAVITGTAAANAALDAIVLAAGSSAVDDFYKGFPIQHAGIGAGIRANSIIRKYNGTTKVAELSETLGAAIATGVYNIPIGLFYTLSTGLAIPLLSCSIWRHKKRYDYRDCALSSFALNIPVSNDAQTDSPSIEFSMVGVDHAEVDQDALAVPDSALLPPPPAKAGKFALNKTLIGHQSLRLEFGLETGAPPNQNFDAGQESYEILSGSRTVTLDLNQQLESAMSLRTLVANQTQIPIESIFGLAAGNRFAVGVANAALNPLSPSGRNGFVGMQGDAVPVDVDRSIAINLIY
ncbi:MAG: hypothetical protein V4696_03695 [Pseudomonadota bacterium]